MIISDKYFKKSLLVVAILSHIFCGFIGIIGPDGSDEIENLLVRVILAFPIFSEAFIFIKAFSGEYHLLILPALIHLVTLLYYIYKEYFQTKSVVDIRRFIDTSTNIVAFFIFFCSIVLLIAIYGYFDIYGMNPILQFIIGWGFVAAILFFPFWLSKIFLHNLLYSHLVIAYILKHGLGKFSSRTLKSILEGKCSICNAFIDEDSIFGNSLIIEKNAIKLICMKCRTGLDLPVILKRKTINRPKIILNMENFTQETSGIELLLSLRTLKNKLGYAHKENSWRRAFHLFFIEDYNNYLSFERSIIDKYGSLEGNHCGECGLSFNEYSNDVSIIDSIQNVECPNCRLPHRFQWFIRTTYKEERDELFNNKL